MYSIDGTGKLAEPGGRAPIRVSAAPSRGPSPGPSPPTMYEALSEILAVVAEGAGPDAAAFSEMAGRRVGERAAGGHSSNPEGSARRYAEAVNQAEGWGTHRVTPDAAEGGELSVEVSGGWESRGQEATGGCFFTAGLWAGLWGSWRGHDMRVDEVSCQGHGGGLCTFVVRASSEPSELRLRRLRKDQAGQHLRANTLSQIGHDLRTPLTIIRDRSDEVIEQLEGGPSGDAVEHARVIKRSAERGLRMLDGLLQSVRISVGGVSMSRERFESRKLLERVAELARGRMRGQRLVLEFDPELPALTADALYLEQALLQLLDNAAIHAPESSIVLMRAYVSEDTLVVEVTDKGPGIPKSALPHIFERFYRVPGREHRGAGMGLGLYLARETLHLHGGKLEVDTRPGTGCTFRATMPVGGVEA